MCAQQCRRALPIPRSVGSVGDSYDNALRDAYTATQFGNVALATQAVQYDTDLLFRRMLLAGRPL